MTDKIEASSQLDHMFIDDPFFYYFKADNFTQAAIRLEQIASSADEAWTRQMQKKSRKT